MGLLGFNGPWNESGMVNMSTLDHLKKQLFA